MVEAKAGDIVVAKNGKRFGILKVVSVGSTFECCTPSHEPMNITIVAEDIVANLGSKPCYGTAYGQTVEPFFKTMDHEIGQVLFYKRVTKVEWNAVKKQLDDVLEWMQDTNTDLFLSIVLKNPKGKTLGCVKTSKSNDIPHQITLYCSCDEIFSTMVHEIAHILWDILLPASSKLDIVESYHDLIMLKNVGGQRLAEIRTGLESCEGIRAFMKEADDDDRKLIRQLFIWIKKIHGIGNQHIDLLLSNGKSISKYFPKTLTVSDFSPSISEYALKSPEELWAEGLRLHAEKVDLGNLDGLIVDSFGLC